MNAVVYTLSDHRGTPLYIGCTVALAARLRSHHLTGWGRFIAHTDVTESMSRADALIVERFAIRLRRPVFNLRDNPSLRRDPYRAIRYMQARRRESVDAYIESLPIDPPAVGA